VTIALGILADDGVVVAADTQVGVADYLKTGQNKIDFARRLEADQQLEALAITGAGPVTYLSHLKQEFRNLIQPGTPPLSAEGLRQYAAKRIEEFYEKHVLPFSAYGIERPDVWLFLAYCDRDSVGLWDTDKNLLTPCRNYTAVGSGAWHASFA
jgi:ATP-dependent protease HslVU (ClpYQ) peptidase subunit